MPDSSLQVKITADVTSLQAQSAVANAELGTLKASVKSLAGQFVLASDEMKASLAPQLDAAAQKLDAAAQKAAALKAETKAMAQPAVTGFFGNLSAGLDNTAEKIEGLTAKFSAIGRLTSAVSEFVLAGLAVDKVAETVNHVAEAGEQMEKLSQETGLSTEQLSGLRVMAVETGTNFDEFTKLLLKLPGTMQEAAINPSSKAAEAFRAMGVSVTDSAGRLRPMSDVLDEVSAKLASYSDGANKTALETDIFGSKIGATLIPMLNQLGQEGLPGAIQQSNRLAQTWSGEDAEAAEQFESDLKRVELGIEGIGTSIVKFALPALDQLAQGFSVMTRTAPILEQINSVQAAIAAREVNRGRFPGADLASLNSQLQALEAQKAIIDSSAAAQSAFVGGAAPGSVSAPSIKGHANLGQRQGASEGDDGEDVADDGDNTDSSGVNDNYQAGVESAKQAQSQITQIAQDAAAARKQIADSEYQTQVSNWNTEVAQGKISKETEIQNEIAAQNQIYEAALQEAQKEAALLPEGTAAKAKQLDDIEVLTAEHNATMAKLNEDLVTAQIDDAKKVSDANQKAADATMAAWQKAFQPISQAFDSSINGILQGTQTLQQAETKAASSIALAFIDAEAKKVVNFVAGEAMILARGIATETGLTAATVAGNASRLASKTAADQTGAAEDVAMGTAQITSSAYKAAAGAYSAVAGVPIVGPVLAPVAAATAFAGVMAFDVLSAEGGMVVPSGINPLTQLHENEMVLPSYISQPLTAMLAGGDTNSSSSTTNLHFNQTVHGGVDSDITATMKKAATGFMNQVVDLTRNGTLRLPGR